jgi:hypothetical protein
MKRQLIYLGILIVAAVAIVALENPFESRLDKDPYGKLFPDLKADAVSSIEISQLMDAALLKKSADGWTAEEASTELKSNVLAKEGKSFEAALPVPADADKIQSALRLIASLPAGIVATNAIDKKDSLQLGVAALSIKGFGEDGKELFSMAIGKSGPDFISTFVTKQGSDKILLVGQPLVGVFSPRVSDWIVPAEKPAPKE